MLGEVVMDCAHLLLGKVGHFLTKYPFQIHWVVGVFDLNLDCGACRRRLFISILKGVPNDFYVL